MENIFQYVMKNFALYYQFDANNISYGIENLHSKVVIRKNVEDSFFKNNHDLDFRNVIRKEWKGTNLPFCFEKNTEASFISFENEQVIINYDVIASSFYFLSGWNEYVSSEKDNLGRPLYFSGVVRTLDIVSLPVVNYYFDIIYEAMLRADVVIKKQIWHKNDFAVNLTHDIDTCLSAWTEGAFSEFKNKRYFNIPKLILKHLWGKDDWFNFQQVSELDRHFAESSTFFFLPRKGKAGNFKNADYDISSRKIRKAMKELINRGHEIGIHGGFGTHSDVGEYYQDLIKINNSEVIGSRFHFLMYDMIKTVKVLEKNGILYDTSLGFAEHIGFRRSFCSPFYLYDFFDHRTSDVLEIPLIVMDATLHYAKYMGLSQERAYEMVTSLIDETKKHNGVFTILWHNTFFSDYKYSGWRDVYLKILHYCQKNNALLTNGRNIFKAVTGK